MGVFYCLGFAAVEAEISASHDGRQAA
ncbi:hypothetical protein EMIT0P176_360016 [Pseudomonas sp. IT-P176]